MRMRHLGGTIGISGALFIAAADQWTKWLVISSSLRESPHIMAPFLRLVYAENTGAAFSLLADSGAWGRYFLSGAAALIIAFLLAWLWRASTRTEVLALMLLIGGAAGNLCDRMRLGYVIDFIDVHWSGYHWPAFNLADSAITVGALLLAWTVLFHPTAQN